jgi:hypothetical protein
MKLTRKDFNLFKSECLAWIDFFGLKEWSVYFVFNNDNPDLMAWCGIGDIEDRLTTIGLSKEFEYEIESDEIRECAFHEVCELMFMPIRRYFEQNGANQKKIDEHIHCLINTLTNTVFKRINPKKEKLKCLKKS